MDQKVNRILFSLIRAEIFGERIEEGVIEGLTQDKLAQLYALSKISND